MKVDFNINWYMSFTPNERGWEKIYHVFHDGFAIKSLEQAISYVNKYKRTPDNKYRDHMHSIMSDLGESMFYMGSNYLENTRITIEIDSSVHKDIHLTY